MNTWLRITAGDLVSERVVEDILSSDKSILGELLSVVPSDLSLVARQKALKSGKLDLLYLYRNEVLLIELKVVGFYDDLIYQLNAYFDDLQELQGQHRLINCVIKKIALVTGVTSGDVEKCASHSIQLIVYDPRYVLSKYYENFKELSRFLTIRSGDYGVVRLGLLKPTLRLVGQGKSFKEICEEEARSNKTIRNRLSVAALLGLVTRVRSEYFLTDFGNMLMDSDDAEAQDRLSRSQIDLLSDFVIQTPFYSSITYTILCCVESVFVLARNRHPVPKEAVRDYFVKSVGKEQTWKADKARETATYIFSNYACELGLLTKIGDDLYITPKGIQAILLLQLNRSIKLIESQSISGKP